MINSKKGLSDIVTNVLIILLVLIAVGIIWRFVLPVINQSSSAVGGASDCITLNVKPLSCFNAFTPEDQNDPNSLAAGHFSIQRGVGSGNLAGVRIVKTQVTGAQVTYDDKSPAPDGVQALTELSTYIFYEDETKLGRLSPGEKIQVGAIVSDGSNGQKVCPLNPVTITC